MTIPKKSLAGEEPERTIAARPAEEMRPGEIIQAIAQGPFAFIPVSPMLEWHSYHLPLGVDALVSEGVARQICHITGGVWFRPLSFGLDSTRNGEQLAMWGFNQDEQVYGMNFPDVPLASEYCLRPEMIAAVRNRLAILARMKVKHAFIINHHGGAGQVETLQEIAAQATTATLRVHAVRTYQFNDLTEAEGFYGVGGHADYSETLWLLAFRPELVDVSTLPEGELAVRKYGILHNKPVIEARWNPRNVDVKVAQLLNRRVVDNFVKYINAL